MAGVADIYIVFAINRSENENKGITAFIVEKDIQVFNWKKEKKLGIRSSPTTEIIFEECKVPKENVLGQEGEGFKIAMMNVWMGDAMVSRHRRLGLPRGHLMRPFEYAKRTTSIW